jgi:hypothetical protein
MGEKERCENRAKVRTNFLMPVDRDLKSGLLSGQNIPERSDLKYIKLRAYRISDFPVESKPFSQVVVHRPRN